MRIVLGPIEMPSEGFGFLLSVFYVHGLFYVGLIIGSIIAFLFILLDIFYLKKKLKHHSKKTSIRFILILVITACVSIIHYVLEKVIDVI